MRDSVLGAARQQIRPREVHPRLGDRGMKVGQEVTRVGEHAFAKADGSIGLPVGDVHAGGGGAAVEGRKVDAVRVDVRERRFDQHLGFRVAFRVARTQEQLDEAGHGAQADRMLRAQGVARLREHHSKGGLRLVEFAAASPHHGKLAPQFERALVLGAEGRLHAGRSA